MRLIDLFEAPLADIQLHGGWDDKTSNQPPMFGPDVSIPDQMKNNSFVSKRDRELIQSPEVHAKLYKVFEKHGTTFYLYLVNDPAMQTFALNLDYGIITPNDTEFKSFAPNLQKQLKSLSKEKVIQVILTHNEGGKQRYPMTPWMIIHRLGHAFFGAGGGDVDPILGGKQIKEITNDFFVSLKPAYDDLGYAGGTASRSYYLYKLCTFGSARNQTMLNVESNFLEFYVELFTQYIWEGKITFNKPYEYFFTLNDTYAKPTREDVQSVHKLVNPELAEACIQKYKKRLEVVFNDAMQRAQGKILVC